MLFILIIASSFQNLILVHFGRYRHVHCTFTVHWEIQTCTLYIYGSLVDTDMYTLYIYGSVVDTDMYTLYIYGSVGDTDMYIVHLRFTGRYRNVHCTFTVH